jgi:O-antigen/teichoic acid export membrane protein
MNYIFTLFLFKKNGFDYMKIYNSKSSNNEEYFQLEKFKDNLKAHAVKGAGASLISGFSTFFIQTIGVVILARLLKPADFGLVAMVTSIFVFFRVLRGFGLTDAMLQEKEIDHKKISTLFWINVAFNIFLTLLFAAFGPMFSWFYHEPKITLIAIVISLEIFFGGLATQHRALLKRNFQFYRDAAIDIPSAIFGFGTAILLAWYGWGYWALVSRWLVSAMVEVIGAWTFCQWRPGLPAFGTGVMPMMKFGMNMLGNFSVGYFSMYLDKVLIGWRYGSSSLGYYDRAYYLFMAPTQRMSVPLLHVSVATLSKLREDPVKYKRYYLNAVSTLAFIGFPISAMLVIMSNDIVLLLLGPKWGKTAEIFSVFGFAIGIEMVYSTFAWVHISLGKSDRLMRWSIIGSIFTSISYFIGLHFGTIGIAIAYTASRYILTGPCLWYAGKPINIKLRSIISAIWKYYLSAVCMGILCWYILHSFGSIASIFNNLNIFTRLSLSFIFCSMTYIFIVIAMFKSIKPITAF